MNYANRMFLESIKWDLKYLEEDSMNYYPPSKLKKIIGPEAFDSYLQDLEGMKSDMPRFLKEDDLEGDARVVGRMIINCYRNRKKYEKTKKANKRTAVALRKAEEKASEEYGMLSRKDKDFFSENEDIRLKYSRVRVDFEVPVPFDNGHGFWDIREVKNYCQRKSIGSKIEELEPQIVGPQGHSQTQGGLDLARSKMKELRTLFR